MDHRQDGIGTNRFGLCKVFDFCFLRTSELHSAISSNDGLLIFTHDMEISVRQKIKNILDCYK